MDGLLKIHKHIIDVSMDPANVPASGTICTRLLVPATQTGILIGKQGATVKSIQDDSHCTIRVIGVGNVSLCECVFCDCCFLFYGVAMKF